MEYESDSDNTRYIDPMIALGTLTQWLVQKQEDLEIRERVETIQTTALLRSARILKRVPETWGGSLSLKLQWKTIS